jgi:hypothetical protein
LLDEMSWWRTDHLRFWALEALVIYVRAAAECRAETAPHLWADRGPPRRPARRGDLTSTARTLGCGRTECRRRLREPRPEPAIWLSSNVGLGAPESVICGPLPLRITRHRADARRRGGAPDCPLRAAAARRVVHTERRGAGDCPAGRGRLRPGHDGGPSGSSRCFPRDLARGRPSLGVSRLRVLSHRWPADPAPPGD